MNADELLAHINLPQVERILRRFPDIGDERTRRKLVRAAKAGKDPNLVADLRHLQATRFDVDRAIREMDDPDGYFMLINLMETVDDVLGPEDAQFSRLEPCAALLRSAYEHTGEWSAGWVAAQLGADAIPAFDHLSLRHSWECRDILGVDYHAKPPQLVEIVLAVILRRSDAADAWLRGMTSHLERALLADGWQCVVLHPAKRFTHPTYAGEVSLDAETSDGTTMAFARVTMPA